MCLRLTFSLHSKKAFYWKKNQSERAQELQKIKYSELILKVVAVRVAAKIMNQVNLLTMRKIYKYPPSTGKRVEKFSWIFCDKCQHWMHYICEGSSAQDSKLKV